jgi:hypothetical protein
MAVKNLIVNTQQLIQYQAPNAATGLAGVVAEIYLPSGEKDLVNFADVALVEIAATGIYQGVFTPNAQGEWIVLCHKANGDGQLAKQYSIGAYDVTSVGTAVTTVDGKVVTVSNKVDTVDGKVVTVSGKVDTVDEKVVIVSDKCNTISGKLDTLDGKINAIDTPPMIL